MKTLILSTSEPSNSSAEMGHSCAFAPVTQKVKFVLFFFLLAGAFLSFNPLTAQNIGKINKKINQYYTGPVKEGNFVITIANFIVDKEKLTDEEYGAVLLGGLFISYEKARNDENIAVAVMNSNEEVSMLYVKKSSFRDFMKGKITRNQLLDEMLTVNVNANKSNELTRRTTF